MSLPTNNKKANNLATKNQKPAKGSKFIQSGGASKPLNVAKKVRSTGANRGS